jgi:ligand-binding sensor domain-containing protein
MVGLFARRGDVMKTEEVHSQNTRKHILMIVGTLIAILVLGSNIYRSKTSENWEGYTMYNSGLVHNSVRTIEIDSSDRVWVGTELGGVSVFDGENWQSYTTENSGLAQNNVGTIAIDSSDRIWFGIENSGASVLDGENWETYTTQNSGLVNDRVDTMAIDSSDRVWLGSEYGGLSVFDGENWQSYTTQNSGLAKVNVGAIAIDSAGQVWVGAYVGLSGNMGTTKMDVVSVFDGEKWESYNPLNPDLVMRDFGGGVSTIAIDSSDRVWVGTLNLGISVFDGNSWEGYTTHNSGLVSDYVNTIAIDSSDRVWVGADSGGLSVFNGENWVTYAEYNSGILNERVEAFTADNKGILWIGTNGGINRVPLGGRLQVTPFFTSIRDIFFSPRFSLWFNLLLLIFLGTVALVVVDRRRAMAEQDPTSGKTQSEGKKISKLGFGLRGAVGGVTVSFIACLFVINNPISDGGLELIGFWLVQYGIALLGIPVSLVLGPVAGIVTGVVSKTKSGAVAFLSAFLAQLIIEVPLLWLIYSG